MEEKQESEEERERGDRQRRRRRRWPVRRGAREAERSDGVGGHVRGFRTANYVNCQCCKLPSQFAFILHTIHTVSAHLARNLSTWILLLPPARRGRRRSSSRRRRRGGGEGRRRRRSRESGGIHSVVHYQFVPSCCRNGPLFVTRFQSDKYVLHVAQ